MQMSPISFVARGGNRRRLHAGKVQLCLRIFNVLAQAPFVQKVVKAIHWMNLSPVDKAIGFLVLIRRIALSNF